MELNELKSMWREDFDNLQDSLSLNKSLLNKSNLESSISEYEKLRNVSIMGRNMALVYATISFITAAYFFTHFLISIPLIIGGIAMIYSFTQHMVIESKTDYLELSILEMQRRIQRFRIHTTKHYAYDTGIVLLWFITMAPAYLHYFEGYNVYESIPKLVMFFSTATVLSIIAVFVFKLIYRDIDKKLKNAESALEEIDMFEGFTS